MEYVTKYSQVIESPLFKSTFVFPLGDSIFLTKKRWK